MSGNHKFKVLIVDDDPSIRMLVSNMLRSNGFNPVVAADGSKGVELAKKEHPDLVLMDVNMPVMTGVEACKALKGDPESASIPVVFMTTLGSDSDRMNGFDAGGDDYVIKPVNYKELLARMQRYINAHSNGNVDLAAAGKALRSCIESASALDTPETPESMKQPIGQLLDRLRELEAALKGNA